MGTANEEKEALAAVLGCERFWLYLETTVPARIRRIFFSTNYSLINATFVA
jgi:hypothetical protein